jgi:hypothetical protein
VVAVANRDKKPRLTPKHGVTNTLGVLLIYQVPVVRVGHIRQNHKQTHIINSLIVHLNSRVCQFDQQFLYLQRSGQLRLVKVMALKKATVKLTTSKEMSDTEWYAALL